MANIKTLKKVLNGKFISILLAIAAAFVLFSIPRDQLPMEGKVVFATFGIAGILWLTEAVPLYVTSFVIAGILIIVGGLGAKEVFSNFFDPIIVLFLGGFTISAAFAKYKVDKYISIKLLNLVGEKASLILLSLIVLSAFLSMWMSNTASAALLLPISITILKESGINKNSPLFKAFPLAIAYAATTGGLATIIGSPPNALAVKYLAEYAQSPINIDFTTWIGLMGPITVTMLAIIYLVIVIKFKVNGTKLKIKLHEASLSVKGKITLLVSVLVALMWIFSKQIGLSSSEVALFPIVFFFGSGMLNEKDLKNLNWDTILLFGGGIALGEAVIATGVNNYLSSGLESLFIGIPQLALYVLILAIGILFTVVASNTGAAVVMLPIVIALSTKLGLNEVALVALTTVGVSLDFILPVGTPPSAIAYSSGYLRAKDMIKTGLLLTLFVITVPAVIYYLWY